MVTEFESRKERRLKQRAKAKNQPSGSIYLTALHSRRSVLAGFAVLSAAALGVCLNKGDQSNSELPRTYSEYAPFIKSLDARAKSNPAEFARLAPVAMSAAVNLYVSEFGSDPKLSSSRLSVVSGDEFRKMIAAEGCKDATEPPGENTLGFTDRLSSRAYFWREGFLTDYVTRKPINEPVSMLLAATIHELGHVIPPVVSLDPALSFRSSKTNSIVTASQAQGATVWVESQDASRPGETCKDAYWTGLEEAIIEDSSFRILQKIGYNGQTRSGYADLVSKYRQRVLNPLFAGDHHQLLALQQTSQIQKIFTIVGQKHGATLEAASVEGQKYLLDALLRV